MTQETLAGQVQVSIETIGKIERGVAAPSFATVEHIAAALEVPAAALFGAGDAAIPKGKRGQLLARVNLAFSAMNEDEMARIARMLEAYIGR